jgi:hypothetical protein
MQKRSQERMTAARSGAAQQQESMRVPGREDWPVRAGAVPVLIDLSPVLLAGMMVVLMLTLLAGPAVAQERVDLTRPLAANGVVTIDNPAGDVRVIGWNRSEVRVTGTIAPRAVRFDVTGGGAAPLEVRVVWPEQVQRERGDRSQDWESYLEIFVPAGAQVTARSISAPLSVAQVTGEVRLKSVSGGAQVEGTPRLVDVDNVSGGAYLEVQSEIVSVNTVSGAVQVGDAGDLTVNTVSGNVELWPRALRNGKVRSVSGSIQFTGNPGADLSLESHSGTIELRLPTAVSARIQASTFSGSIQNELGPPAERRSQYVPGLSLSFTAGGGAAQISLNSFSGTIRILRN